MVLVIKRQYETCEVCLKKRCGELYPGTRMYWNYKVCNKCLDSQDPIIDQKVKEYDRQFSTFAHKAVDLDKAKRIYEALKK